jgi:hypothetical protein
MYSEDPFFDFLMNSVLCGADGICVVGFFSGLIHLGWTWKDLVMRGLERFGCFVIDKALLEKIPPPSQWNLRADL